MNNFSIQKKCNMWQFIGTNFSCQFSLTTRMDSDNSKTNRFKLFSEFTPYRFNSKACKAPIRKEQYDVRLGIACRKNIRIKLLISNALFMVQSIVIVRTIASKMEIASTLQIQCDIYDFKWSKKKFSGGLASELFMVLRNVCAKFESFLYSKIFLKIILQFCTFLGDLFYYYKIE